MTGSTCFCAPTMMVGGDGFKVWGVVRPGGGLAEMRAAHLWRVLTHMRPAVDLAGQAAQRTRSVLRKRPPLGGVRGAALGVRRQRPSGGTQGRRRSGGRNVRLKSRALLERLHCWPSATSVTHARPHCSTHVGRRDLPDTVIMSTLRCDGAREALPTESPRMMMCRRDLTRIGAIFGHPLGLETLQMRHGRRAICDVGTGACFAHKHTSTHRKKLALATFVLGRWGPRAAPFGLVHPLPEFRGHNMQATSKLASGRRQCPPRVLAVCPIRWERGTQERRASQMCSDPRPPSRLRRDSSTHPPAVSKTLLPPGR